MSVKNRMLAGVTPFAHLNGPVTAVASPVVAEPAPAAPAAAEPDDPKPDPTTKAKKVKKGEKDDDDSDDDSDDDGDDSSDEQDMRAAEDDEDTDSDMKKTKKAEHRIVRAARLRERARCAAIFGHAAAAGNPALAAQLAFMSNTTRSQAVGILSAAGPAAGAKPGLHARMASVPQPVVAAGAGAPATRPADRALAAADKARPGTAAKN